jgi:hypothetical protein
MGIGRLAPCQSLASQNPNDLPPALAYAYRASTMKLPTPLGILIAAFMAFVPTLRAADSPPSPVFQSITLRDGRVLHNVKIMSNEGESIVVHADEGLLKIEKVNLPAGIVDSAPEKPSPSTGPDMVMQAFNPNDAPVQDPGPKPQSKVTPAPKAPMVPKTPEANAVFRGCTIVSFQVKVFQNVQGCAEVVIRNDTDTPAILSPRDMVCIAARGARHTGRFFVTDGFPPQIKRREIVPAHGQIDDTVTFTDDRLEISSVEWVR